ncbi:Uncharacterised protein [uncultured archaeon]|nr:Uncharacterised protein [uncultured archaeon]
MTVNAHTDNLNSLLEEKRRAVATLDKIRSQLAQVPAALMEYDQHIKICDAKIEKYQQSLAAEKSKLETLALKPNPATQKTIHDEIQFITSRITFYTQLKETRKQEKLTLQTTASTSRELEAAYVALIIPSLDERIQRATQAIITVPLLRKFGFLPQPTATHSPSADKAFNLNPKLPQNRH